jgi:hypothetical protein
MIIQDVCFILVWCCVCIALMGAAFGVYYNDGFLLCFAAATAVIAFALTLIGITIDV